MKQPKFFIFLLTGVLGALCLSQTAMAGEIVISRTGATKVIIDPEKVIPEPVLDRETDPVGFIDPEGVEDDSFRVLPPEPVGVADDSVRVLPPERTDEESWFSHWNSAD